MSQVQTIEPQMTPPSVAAAIEPPGMRRFLWIFGAAACGTLIAIMAYHVGNMERLDREYFNPRVAGVSGAGGGAAVAGSGNPQHGGTLFSSTCFACHGPTGEGVPNVGPSLRASKFVASTPDDQLISFIKVGRLPGQPGSVMNGMMPSKGGNPALDDSALRDIVAFLRQLQSGGRADAGGPAPVASMNATR